MNNYTRDIILEHIREHETMVEALADSLIGTCYYFNDDEWTQKELMELDDLVFCCESCGWWLDIYELNLVDGIGSCCEQCTEENKDE